MSEPRKKKATTKKTVHWHACTTCPHAYEDNCTQTTTNARCAHCLGSPHTSYLVDNRRPRACCQSDSRLVTKAEKATYRLAGSKPWFICTTCWRQHTYNPAVVLTRSN